MRGRLDEKVILNEAYLVIWKGTLQDGRGEYRVCIALWHYPNVRNLTIEFECMKLIREASLGFFSIRELANEIHLQKKRQVPV